MKNILVVDDHPSIRKYAILLLKDEFKEACFHESEGENDALKKVSEIEMDVVMLDLEIKEGNGFSLIQRIRERYPDQPILVNTMYEKPDFLHRALDMGANGYVSKRDDPQCIIEAIHDVQHGTSYFSPSIMPLLVQGFQNKKNDTVDNILNSLSKREREVFSLISQEFPRNEIADRLNISPRTVETHIERMRRKLNIESGKKLEYFAIKQANQTERLPFDPHNEEEPPTNL
jgi:RNA polymerase sigma factor (sigma-70 family)